MKVYVRKNILMVKLVCVFKVAEYTLKLYELLITQNCVFFISHFIEEATFASL